MESIKKGHLPALFTILVWGTTFLSTKVLLSDFRPPEILFFRMCLAILALTLTRPRRLRLADKRHELYFAGAGLCGVTLYSLLENMALTYTYSANCSVILSTAPFFVALAIHWCFKTERFSMWFFAGFVVAIAGIILISFSGRELKINPVGDLLCLLAAVAWAGYSVCIQKVNAQGYDTLLVTRRVFCYGLAFLLPCLPFLDFSPDWAKLAKPENWLNFLFLGLCASALCFVAWNMAVKSLGAIKTSLYIYVIPVVTIAAAALLFQDPLPPLAAVGAGLTLLGLIVSQRGTKPLEGAARAEP